jgi:hypothetical protein
MESVIILSAIGLVVVVLASYWLFNFLFFPDEEFTDWYDEDEGL